MGEWSTIMWVWIGVIALVVLGVMGFNVMRLVKIRSAGKEFLQRHPDAAKLYLATEVGLTSCEMQLHSIDDAPPQGFSEGARAGYYLLPGARKISVSCVYTRPGVVNRSGATTYGPYNTSIDVEPNKAYRISFDCKEEKLVFEEDKQ